MRSASANLSAHLDLDTVTLIRHLVTLTLRGGVSVYQWTDHDSDVFVAPYTYFAGGVGNYPLIKIGARKEMAGTEIGTLDMTFYCGETATLGSTPLPAAAARGDLDGAWVRVERLFLAPGLLVNEGVMHLLEGPVGEVKPSSNRVDITVETGLALLTRPWPPTLVQAGCTHALYSTECGIDKGGRTVTGSVVGVVGDSPTPSVINTSTWDPDDYFNLGVLTFTSGPCNGVSRGVKDYVSVGGVVTFDRPLPARPNAGDTFSVYPGCDKKRTTCAGKFVNSARFRGFPYLPKNEEAL